jgi:hypothetical protein
LGILAGILAAILAQKALLGVGGHPVANDVFAAAVATGNPNRNHVRECTVPLYLEPLPRKQKGATKPLTPKDESGPTKKSQKDEKEWGPVGAAAKKAAKGAAIEIVK